VLGFHQLQFSMEHHEWVSINVSPHSGTIFISGLNCHDKELTLTAGACHCWDSNSISLNASDPSALLAA